MSLELIIMRHAKSDWKTPAADDFSRPLNKRGVEAARTVGKWLHQNGHIPELIYCSSATRTRETLNLVKASFPGSPHIEHLDSLYLASAEAMFQTVSQTTSGARCVMLLAHNPGCAMLANALCKTPPAHPKFRSFPTAATCILKFSASSWARIEARSGLVAGFITPKDL